VVTARPGCLPSRNSGSPEHDDAERPRATTGMHIVRTSRRAETRMISFGESVKGAVVILKVRFDTPEELN
jgi:hypothetical protein